MTGPGALAGDRRQVARVGAIALETAAPAGPRDWLVRLAAVQRDRRDAVRELRQAGHGAASRDLVTRGERFGLPGVVWWVALVAATVLVVAGAALLLPVRRSSTRTVVDGLWEAPPPMVLGALLLSLLAVLPVPAVVRESVSATGTALCGGSLALGTLVYNLLRLDVLRAAEHGHRSVPYLLAAALAAAAAAVVALRARERPPLHRVHWRAAARRARRDTAWLLAHQPEGEGARAAERAFETALRRLGEGEVEADLVEDALDLGPWHVLVAAVHDGELDLPAVRVPPPPRGVGAALRRR